MIKQSFILLDKIGKKGEKNIWKQCIHDWDGFISANKIKGISKKIKPYYNNKLLKAKKELYLQNSSYFADILPSTEIWRLYRYFKNEAVFLDIETTGIKQEHDIIVIGLFDGYNTKLMIKGTNLDYNYLKEELKKYKLIITYNGASFDIPFIKKRYPDLLPNIPHLDLKPLCKKCGFVGGLKKIEKEFGIKRNPILNKLYGGDVLRLWRMYRASGDDYYLNLLVEYNEDDVINLKKIAESVIGRMEDKMKSIVHLSVNSFLYANI